ncbi:MAG: RluA family pseudouridine synthase [Magnetospirillum sp. WYHS-4]
MTGVLTKAVADDEGDLRLDRWFRRHFPQVTHGRLEKWLRTGQVRVDGKRVKASQRLAAGQTVRVPPLGEEEPTRAPAPRKPAAPMLSENQRRDLEARVLHKDALVLVIDKPAGLAVQGGTGTDRHLDGMLDALRFEAAERPRLVHRLDRDTSGVLVLARNARAAAFLADAFRSKEARKLYWALVVGLPERAMGKISLPIAKLPGRAGERMAVDYDEGKRATTLYRVVERAGASAAWLAMEPLTGRTHQLRVHAAEGLGTPIHGDGKYGAQKAFLDGEGLSRKLHLHARAIRIPHPAGGILEVFAPLPEHMRRTWKFLGFSEKNPDSGFLDEG